MFKAPSDELFTLFLTLSSILCTHSVPSPSCCSQMVGIMRLYQINNPDWQQEGNMITFFLWHRPQLNTGADDRPPKEERELVQTKVTAPCLLAPAGLRMSTAFSSSVSPAWKSWLKLARSQAKETNCNQMCALRDTWSAQCLVRPWRQDVHRLSGDTCQMSG